MAHQEEPTEEVVGSFYVVATVYQRKDRLTSVTSALFVSRKPLARRVVPKKTYVDHGEIKTPFAIIGVRSANCTNKQREVIQK